MISELNDKEILDFLMTSNFNDDYSPSEFKYLLNKWRYFYKVLHATNSRDKDYYEGLINRNEEQLDINTQKLNELTKKLNHEKLKFEKLKNRKLSWKERFTGKINVKEDEN